MREIGESWISSKQYTKLKLGGTTMKYLEHYATVILSMLLILSLSTPVFAQGAQADHLVGWWLFDDLTDETGNFPDITLKGAKLDKGQLDVSVGKWALATGKYTGPEIKEKTMVCWFLLDDLNVQRGSVLTIDKISVDEFDAMVLGERQRGFWMAGSSFFRRTTDPKPGFEEKKTGEIIFLAYTYADEGGQARLKLYHNGEKFGDYKMGAIASWPAGDAEIFWGIRHGNEGGGPDNMDAHIEESRIYDVVLTQDEIKTLEVGTLSVEAQGKLTTRWATIKTR
jgi:hypothetical protein